MNLDRHSFISISPAQSLKMLTKKSKSKEVMWNNQILNVIRPDQSARHNSFFLLYMFIIYYEESLKQRSKAKEILNSSLAEHCKHASHLSYDPDIGKNEWYRQASRYVSMFIQRFLFFSRLRQIIFIFQKVMYSNIQSNNYDFHFYM